MCARNRARIPMGRRRPGAVRLPPASPYSAGGRDRTAAPAKRVSRDESTLAACGSRLSHHEESTFGDVGVYTTEGVAEDWQRSDVWLTAYSVQLTASVQSDASSNHSL
jgi:hypothetical protein